MTEPSVAPPSTQPDVENLGDLQRRLAANITALETDRVILPYRIGQLLNELHDTGASWPKISRLTGLSQTRTFALAKAVRDLDMAPLKTWESGCPRYVADVHVCEPPDWVKVKNTRTEWTCDCGNSCVWLLSGHGNGSDTSCLV